MNILDAAGLAESLNARRGDVRRRLAQASRNVNANEAGTHRTDLQAWEEVKSMVHHRARMYWIVSIVQSDTPYACEYSVKSYGGILHHVKIRLGYKQPQYELQAYMRRIMKDMIRTHDIPKITPQWMELASKNEKAGIGTVKYVITCTV